MTSIDDMKSKPKKSNRDKKEMLQDIQDMEDFGRGKAAYDWEEVGVCAICCQ